MEEKDKRKSARGFNLEKPQKRTFNLEKETETIKEPIAVTKGMTADSKQAAPQTEEAQVSSGGGKKWILLAVLLLLIVLGVMALRGFDNKDADVTEKAPVESVSDSTDKEKADSTSSVEQSQAPESNEQQEASGEQNSNANTNSSSSDLSTGSPVAITVEQKAMQVWDGVYGNGAERKAKLGSDYAAVQKRVNEMYQNGYRH